MLTMTSIGACSGICVEMTVCVTFHTAQQHRCKLKAADVNVADMHDDQAMLCHCRTQQSLEGLAGITLQRAC